VCSDVHVPVPTSITTADHHDLDLRVVSGAWPEGISGEVVISAPQVAADLPYALFGFGRLCRLSLRPGTHGAPADRFAWRSRLIDSPSRRLFERLPERFVAGPTGYSSPLGFPNAANTAPLPWGDRLFATWDVGRPVEVDPDTLGFLGEVGHHASWGEPTLRNGGVLPFLFSSAHPVVDPERGCLWTVKLTFDASDRHPAGAMQLHVVRWSGDSTTVDVWPVEGGIVVGSAHTLSQSRSTLVLADSGNFRSDPGEMAGGPRTVTVDDDAAVYLLDKDRIEATPPGTPVVPVTTRVAPTTGHFFARWDDTDGVEVLFEHMDRMDLGFRLEAGDLDATGRPVDPALVGFYNMGMSPSSISEVVYDRRHGTGEVVAVHRDERSWNLELSAMDWSLEGTTEPTLHHVAYQGCRPGGVSRRAVEAYGDRLSHPPTEDTPGELVSFRRGGLGVAARWEYPDTGDHITSPTFVPRSPGTTPDRSRQAGVDPGGHDGWVVLPVLSDDGFRVDVFDAADVGAGPVATLAAPGGACVPVLLHAAWRPVTTDHGLPEVERLRFADDVADRLGSGRLDDELVSAVRAVAAELDDGARS
jgi:all-trans-8'-apo-beta-carotenal 15,15'-oxygenase